VLAQILAPLMAEVRQQMGDGPVYLSFDIDSLDPIWARNRHAGSRRPDLDSGAGNRPRLPRPEPDWLRSGRGLAPYDVSGNTSQLAANLLYEMLCVLPGVKYP
jgi:guanidinobutyrase